MVARLIAGVDLDGVHNGRSEQLSFTRELPDVPRFLRRKRLLYRKFLVYARGT